MQVHIQINTAYQNTRQLVPVLLPVPSGSPEIVSFTPDENLPVLTLSWTPPEEGTLNGPLSGISYRVRYGVLGRVATVVAVSSSQTSGSSVQQYVMRNLEYGSTYVAQVAAESSNGTGPYSTTITQTTVTISKCAHDLKHYDNMHAHHGCT